MDKEQMLEKKLEKWWKYRKWSAVILFAVLVLTGFLIAQDTHSVSYDFYVSLVTAEQMPEQELEALQQRLDGAAWDRNHDGVARVLIWSYLIGSDDSVRERLEQDLGSFRSGMFLFDRAENVEDVLTGEPIPISSTGLYAILSSEHMEARDYQKLLDSLKS